MTLSGFWFHYKIHFIKFTVSKNTVFFPSELFKKNHNHNGLYPKFKFSPNHVFPALPLQVSSGPLASETKSSPDLGLDSRPQVHRVARMTPLWRILNSKPFGAYCQNNYECSTGICRYVYSDIWIILMNTLRQFSLISLFIFPQGGTLFGHPTLTVWCCKILNQSPTNPHRVLGTTSSRCHQILIASPSNLTGLSSNHHNQILISFSSKPHVLLKSFAHQDSVTSSSHPHQITTDHNQRI